jgi:hypothetical protein
MNFVKLIEGALKDAEKQVDWSAKDPGRVFYLRPSSFPYCGLKKALSIDELTEERQETLASNYYTGVGTTTHSVFQKYVGLTGKLVGDYKCLTATCKNKGILKEFTTDSICKVCKKPMLYEELSFKLKSLIGHTDGILKFVVDKKDYYVVIDFKTTSTRKIWEDRKKTVFPYKGNVSQIEVYVTTIEEKYKISISGYSLIYLPRDAPLGRNVKVCYTSLTKSKKEEMSKKLFRTIKIHTKAIKATTVEDFEVLKKYKMCKSLADYNENYKDAYNPCPHVSKCFKEDKIDTVIARRLKDFEYPLLSHAPSKIQKDLNGTSS